MTDYILAIDQGTTSSRAILFDAEAQLHFQAQEEFPQHFPKDGWVEHNPDEIWRSTLGSCRQVLSRIGADDQILAIGITNQRETTLVWDRRTGEPVYPAIVWQDRRTSHYCQQIRTPELQASIQQKTGLLLDPYFSATKLHWILTHVPDAKKRAAKGDLLFGTVDTYLIWKLTGGKVHRTDATNASRTLLFNIHKQCWDEDLLKLFEIPCSMLPEVMDCADNFGITDAKVLGNQIPILGVAGDQQAALIGQACFKQGMAKSTYGTGCFLMLNTGETPLISNNRLLTTVAYRFKGKTCYALEGSIFVAGAAIQWLRDGLKIIKNAAETEQMACQVPIDHGVYLVPAFAGLGAPYWDPEARGAIFGLTRDTGINELVSAALQSVCFQTKDLVHAMENDGVKPTTLRVDGGMVRNNWLMQFLADMLGITVDRPHIIETTALGAAYLAGLQSGLFGSLSTLEKLRQTERQFVPEICESERKKFYTRWQKAVTAIKTH